MRNKYFCAIVFSLCGSVAGCDAESELDEPAVAMREAIVDSDEPQILSTYFGVNDLPGVGIAARAGCDPHSVMGLKDGMPIVFDVEIDQTTLDASDFKITFIDDLGILNTVSPECVGLPPAGDEPEDRTVLTVGQYGDGTGVQQISIVDPLLDEEGRNLQGLTFDEVTPVGVGPSMIYAEQLLPDEWEPLDDEPMSGNECAIGTLQIVQVTWAGWDHQRFQYRRARRPGADGIPGDSGYARRLGGRRSLRSGVTSTTTTTTTIYVWMWRVLRWRC